VLLYRREEARLCRCFAEFKTLPLERHIFPVKNQLHNIYFSLTDLLPQECKSVIYLV